jgi:hypothetical protein
VLWIPDYGFGSDLAFELWILFDIWALAFVIRARYIDKSKLAAIINSKLFWQVAGFTY